MHEVIPATRVERLSPPQSVVGESVRWDDRRRMIFYVDILGKALRRYDSVTGEHQAWTCDTVIGGWFPSLSRHLAPEDRAAHPNEGALFAIRPGRTGDPEHRFAA